MNKKLKGWVKAIGKALLFGVILAVSIQFFGAYGFIGFLIIILGMAGFRLYKMRKNYADALRYIEDMIWKKPLDKKYWGKGEMKNTKVKIRWRKKKDENIPPN